MAVELTAKQHAKLVKWWRKAFTYDADRAALVDLAIGACINVGAQHPNITDWQDLSPKAGLLNKDVLIETVEAFGARADASSHLPSIADVARSELVDDG